MAHAGSVDRLLEVLFAVVGLLAGFNPAADPCTVLDGLDTRREIAWAHGDPGLLAGVWATPAGESGDREMLTAWAQRGLRVEGLQMERDSCQPVPGGVYVVERVSHAVAVGHDQSRRQLPTGAWTARDIALTFSTRWRISSVHTVSQPAL